MSRSHGAKVGRLAEIIDVDWFLGPAEVDQEYRVEAGSDVSLLFNRTFLIAERWAGKRSLAVAGVAGVAVDDDFGLFSGAGGAGLEMDSKTR